MLALVSVAHRVILPSSSQHEVLDGLSYMVAELATEGAPGALDKYPQLAAYKARFEALPPIAAFRASPTYLSRPFNNKVALWK